MDGGPEMRDNRRRRAHQHDLEKIGMGGTTRRRNDNDATRQNGGFQPPVDPRLSNQVKVGNKAANNVGASPPTTPPCEGSRAHHSTIGDIAQPSSDPTMVCTTGFQPPVDPRPAKAANNVGASPPTTPPGEGSRAHHSTIGVIGAVDRSSTEQTLGSRCPVSPIQVYNGNVIKCYRSTCHKEFDPEEILKNLGEMKEALVIPRPTARTLLKKETDLEQLRVLLRTSKGHQVIEEGVKMDCILCPSHAADPDGLSFKQYSLYWLHRQKTNSPYISVSRERHANLQSLFEDLGCQPADGMDGESSGKLEVTVAAFKGYNVCLIIPDHHPMKDQLIWYLNVERYNDRSEDGPAFVLRLGLKGKGPKSYSLSFSGLFGGQKEIIDKAKELRWFDPKAATLHRKRPKEEEDDHAMDMSPEGGQRSPGIGPGEPINIDLTEDFMDGTSDTASSEHHSKRRKSSNDKGQGSSQRNSPESFSFDHCRRGKAGMTHHAGDEQPGSEAPEEIQYTGLHDISMPYRSDETVADNVHSVRHQGGITPTVAPPLLGDDGRGKLQTCASDDAQELVRVLDDYWSKKEFHQREAQKVEKKYAQKVKKVEERLSALLASLPENTLTPPDLSIMKYMEHVRSLLQPTGSQIQELYLLTELMQLTMDGKERRDEEYPGFVEWKKRQEDESKRRREQHKTILSDIHLLIQSLQTLKCSSTGSR